MGRAGAPRAALNELVILMAPVPLMTPRRGPGPLLLVVPPGLLPLGEAAGEPRAALAVLNELSTTNDPLIMSSLRPTTPLMSSLRLTTPRWGSWCPDPGAAPSRAPTPAPASIGGEPEPEGCS